MRKLLVLILSLTSIYTYASDSYGFWPYVLAKKKMSQHFGASVYGELRTTDYLKRVDMCIGLVSADFYIMPWLSGDMAYAFVGKYKPEQTKQSEDTRYDSYWIPMNRFHTSVSARHNLGKWTLGIKEQYQLTQYKGRDVDGHIISTGEDAEPLHTKGKTIKELRSRFKINYTIGRFSPNTYVELYNDFSDFCTISKIKWTIGTEYSLNKSMKMELCYRLYQKRVPSITNEHILGLGYILII